MPEWIFERLRIREGEPVCLIFDFEEIKKMTASNSGEDR
jgi:hypothetical protein